MYSCSPRRLLDNRPRHCQFAHSKSRPAKLHVLLYISLCAQTLHVPIVQHLYSAVCISLYKLAAALCMLAAYDFQPVYDPQQVSQSHPCPGVIHKWPMHWCSILSYPLHCWCCSSQAQGKRKGQPCFADTARVQQGPALAAAAQRHPLTPSPLAHPGIRVVTYNILADQYASREHSQKVLFGYCPKR